MNNGGKGGTYVGDELREAVGFFGVSSDIEPRRDCTISDDEKLWSARAAESTASGLSKSFAMILGSVRTTACNSC